MKKVSPADREEGRGTGDGWNGVWKNGYFGTDE
jgi:hypothetical protein